MKNRNKKVKNNLVEALKLGIALSERNENNGSESQYFRHIARLAVRQFERGK